MRTLLALLFAFVLILTTLQADAVKEENEQRTKAKRQLLSETALGRKGNARDNDAKDLSKKGSATANTNTANSSNDQGTAKKNDINDDDDHTNESYHNYGNGSGTSTDSHHYFVDDRRPPVHG